VARSHEMDGVDVDARPQLGRAGAASRAWAVLRALLVAELSEAGVAAWGEVVLARGGVRGGAGRVRGAAWRPVLHVARHVAGLSAKEVGGLPQCRLSLDGGR